MRTYKCNTTDLCFRRCSIRLTETSVCPRYCVIDGSPQKWSEDSIMQTKKETSRFDAITESPEALAKFMVDNNCLFVNEDKIVEYLNREI